MKPFHVYILRCGDGSYYTGHTDDISARLQQHHDGGVGYTATRKPVELVWQGEFETREGALAFELQVKGWSRAKKEALMAGDWKKVRDLARSHGAPANAAGVPAGSTVRPEFVEGHGQAGLRQAQPERGEAQPVWGEAHPERGDAQSERGDAQSERGDAQSERGDAHRERRGAEETSHAPPVRPELVEGHARAGLRQAQPERGGAQPERVQAQPERVQAQPERVEAQPERGDAQPERGRAERSLADRVVHGDPAGQRRAIAKAITLLESTRADHRDRADALLTELLPHSGKSFRLGISGVPGVGKSTFIEALGLSLIARGHRVAVLAIDPSSSLSGGSILGDKTRMEHLSVHPRAYIRPSPASGALGGVAAKTRESMLVCEAAGYDIVIVETVGVGQSEIAVAGMTDMFVLLQLPNAGDDLQAIKKGVMELADLVVINKADIDPDAATRARAQITSALRILGQHGNPEHAHHDAALWHPQVLQLSAIKGEGLDRFWQAVTEFRTLQEKSGRLAARRRHQALAWMWERIESGLRQAFRQHPEVKSLLPGITKQVEQGTLAASTAARQLLKAMEAPGSSPGRASSGPA